MSFPAVEKSVALPICLLYQERIGQICRRNSPAKNSLTHLTPHYSHLFAIPEPPLRKTHGTCPNALYEETDAWLISS